MKPVLKPTVPDGETDYGAYAPRKATRGESVILLFKVALIAGATAALIAAVERCMLGK